MARRYRPRKLFKFWLYHDLAADTHLMEYIDYLRKTRQFATVLRQGLRLMWTLGEGDTSLLYELFPTLRSQLVPDNTDLIEQFRQMLQAQIAVLPQVEQPQLRANKSAQALPAPHINEPAFEEQDTVIIRRDTQAGQANAANFLKAAFGFQGLEVSDNQPDTHETASGGIKEIPGMKAITMPSFEDEEDDLLPAAIPKPE